MTTVERAIKGSLTWQHVGVEGDQEVFRGTPTQSFWTMWRSRKDELRALGVRVAKRGDAWSVEWRTSCFNDKPRVRKQMQRKVPALRNKRKLFKEQVPHVARLVQAIKVNHASLDGSDTGVGKTICNLAVARELKMSVFVVCPKTVRPTWERWAKHIGVDLLDAENYEKLRFGNTIYVKKIGKGKKAKFQWTLDPKKYMIIFDEAHRCKGAKTLNSEMMISAAEQGFRTALLSATIADSPLHFKAVGLALGLFNSPAGFWRWAEGYGCEQVVFGDKFRVGKDDPRAAQRMFMWTDDPVEQEEAIVALHERIYQGGLGSRLTVADMGNAFPKNQVIAEPYAVDAKLQKKINDAYERLREQMEILEQKRESAEHAMTKILHARQEIELLKTGLFVELAQDAYEEGMRVAIFVNFTDTLEEVAHQLKTKCVVRGGQKASVREANRLAFQADEEPYIVCNLQSGGVGMDLHDLHGNHPRYSLISPSHSGVDVKQALGRIFRAGAKTPARQRLVFVSGTIEEEVAENVQEKLKRMSLLNDGAFRGL